MPSFDPPPASDAPYIPAWKRLGLKLKPVPKVILAKEAEPTKDTKSRQAKRNRDTLDTGDVLPPSKAARRENQSRSQIIAGAATTQNGLSPSVASSATLPPRTISVTASTSKQSLKTPALKKRRSVAFTPDTKIQDGDSKQRFIPAAELAFIASQLKSQPNPPNKSPKNPKAKKQKSSKDPASTQKTDAIQAAITYLLQHHQSPNQWKFNKSKQNSIIKHLFNIWKLPPQYNEALRGYIAGLKGRGIRARIKEVAEKVVKAAEEEKEREKEQDLSPAPDEMDDPAARKRAYDEALDDHMLNYANYVAKRKEKDALHRAEMSRRTDLVLAALAESIDPAQVEEPEERKKRAKLNDGTAKGGKRKRKQRTTATEEEESSSSDDDTSDSDAEKPGESSSSEEDGESSESNSSSSSSSSSSSGSDSEGSSSSSGEESSSSGSDDDDDDADNDNS